MRKKAARKFSPKPSQNFSKPPILSHKKPPSILLPAYAENATHPIAIKKQPEVLLSGCFLYSEKAVT